MQVVFVTAEIRQATDTHAAVSQVVSGKFQSGVDPVLAAGYAEELLVQMLKIGQAQAEGVSQFRHGAGCGRIVVELGAQPGKFGIVFPDARGVRPAFQFFLQGIQENAHEGVQDFSLMDGGCMIMVRHHPHIL